MPYTDDQIANYAHQLEQKGAPPSDIEGFVKAAKQEQMAAPKVVAPSTTINNPAPNQRLSEADQKAYNDNFLRQNKESIGKVAGAAIGALKNPFQAAESAVATVTPAVVKTMEAQPGEKVATEEDWNRTAERVGKVQQQQEEYKAAHPFEGVSDEELQSKLDIANQDVGKRLLGSPENTEMIRRQQDKAGIIGDIARPFGNIVENTRVGVGEGVTKGAEGIGEIGQAINPFSDMPADERVLKGTGGVFKTISGGLETAFAPASAVVNETPVVKDVVGFGMEKVNQVSQFGADKFKETLGIDPNSEQGKVIDQGFNVLGQLMTIKAAKDTTETLAAKKGMAKAMETIEKKGIQSPEGMAALSKIEKLSVQKPTITGNLGANVIEGAKAVLSPASKAADFFGEKTGVKGLVTKSADTLRSEKMTKGLSEQNNRIKTVNNAFNENTKTYTTPDGSVTKITPIDTLSKNKIFPKIEKGTIEMGDYKTGTGALGEIKIKVENLDAQIDTILKNTGTKLNIEELRSDAIAKAKANPEFKQSGTVSTNVKKIDTRFDDYKASYGDTLDIAEINNIRKVANRDWSPETQDTSRIIGDVARDKVYNATDDMAVKTLLKEQSELLSAKKYAEKLNGTKVKGGRLGTYAARGTGATIGAAAGAMIPGLSLITGPMGMVIGDYLGKATQNLQFKSPLAEAKGFFTKSGEKFSEVNLPKTTFKSAQETLTPKEINKVEPVTKTAKLTPKAQEILDNNMTSFERMSENSKIKTIEKLQKMGKKNLSGDEKLALNALLKEINQKYDLSKMKYTPDKPYESLTEKEMAALPY